MALLLFGGKLKSDLLEGIVSIDEWIR